jgi:hypothetical protein
MKYWDKYLLLTVYTLGIIFFFWLVCYTGSKIFKWIWSLKKQKQLDFSVWFVVVMWVLMSSYYVYLASQVLPYWLHIERMPEYEINDEPPNDHI